MSMMRTKTTAGGRPSHKANVPGGHPHDSAHKRTLFTSGPHTILPPVGAKHHTHKSKGY